MGYISAKEIDKFIEEDQPYFDLTTNLLKIEGIDGKIEFYTRERTVLSGVEEVLNIFKRLNIRVIENKKSGDISEAGEVFISGEGKSEDLHTAWKVSQNILEYSSGIATRTRKIVDKARAVNKTVSIASTRKVFPGTKKLSLKGVIAGGGIPHRLGLSDSVLIFKQHINFLGDEKSIQESINAVKIKAPEKKIIIEAENFEEVLKYAKLNIDGIQIDKAEPQDVKKAVTAIKEINSNIVVLAAGGVNAENAEEYAKAGAEVLVTTSVYFGKPADIGVKIDKIKNN